jgi:hypothetical protein
MSLISYASPWSNSDNMNSSRKRVPTMRKTIKKPAAIFLNENNTTEYSSYNNNPVYADEYISDTAKYNLIQPATLDDGQEDRSKKVNDLLNKITSQENAGSGLASFTPPPNPVVQVRGDPIIEPDEPISQLPNPLQFPRPAFQNDATNSRFLSKDPAQSSYSSYHNTYDPTNVKYRPNLYNPQQNQQAMPADKMLEKINYMIHLLENMEAEKTANITEEFILYAFLGVFIIFIVDSFSRGGKYIK